MSGRSRMEISMAAEPDSVRLARTEIMRWFHDLDAVSDDSLAASIAVAVSEAVGNVVRHAYPGNRTGRVEVVAELADEGIVVSVADGGSGLNARPEREHHGMGLPVIGRVADSVSVQSTEVGTRVSMRFDLVRARGPRRFIAPSQDRAFALSAR